MGMDRRTFLKGVGTGIAAAVPGSSLLTGSLEAKEVAAGKEFMGVLVDTVRCVGCRSCEAACAETNALPIPDIGDSSAL
jgi:formate dehydrogenase iron-sulfur subunit